MLVGNFVIFLKINLFYNQILNLFVCFNNRTVLYSMFLYYVAREIDIASVKFENSIL